MKNIFQEFKVEKPVYSSKNYDLFHFNSFNRSIGKTKDLITSMRLHGFIPDYHLVCEMVNGQLCIKVGHHRFTVAKHLGLPIFFTITDNSATIHELEKSTNPWKLNDYLDSFARLNPDVYATVKDFHERTGIPLNMCISMMAGKSASNHDKIESFKDGKFKFTKAGIEHSEKVAIISKTVQLINPIVGKHKNFITACSRILFVKEFNLKRFLLKIQSNRSMIDAQPTLVKYTEMIEKIYNHGRGEKVPLFFLADEAMKERNHLTNN